MREIMNRFRQWLFFNPLRPSLRKAAIKWKAQPAKNNQIKMYEGLSENVPIMHGPKINSQSHEVQKDFQPLPLPQTQAQPITQVVAPRLSKSYFPLDRVTPLQIEENIHHLTREIDTDGEHSDTCILSSILSAL